MVTPSQTVATNCARLRERRGWTQAQLADLIGLNHQTCISKIEAGTRKVSVDELCALARAFHVQPQEMLVDRTW